MLFALGFCFYLSGCSPHEELLTTLKPLTEEIIASGERYISRDVKEGRYMFNPENFFIRISLWAMGDRQTLRSVPEFDPYTLYSFQVDLDGRNLRKLDLVNDADVLTNLIYSNFDTNTRWPDTLPDGFDPELILELGKNPGLGVRSLHETGVTGNGVSIGMIDSILLPNHIEYTNNLVWYEEIIDKALPAHMHGTATSSIAVGENVGVAPEAKLYYIAAASQAEDGETTYVNYALALHRLLDINDLLPEVEKIRAVSISWGFDDIFPGYDEMMVALNRARENGVFVITTSISYENEYGFLCQGLGRGIMDDPNDLSSYSLAASWRTIADLMMPAGVLFPMDSRTYASHIGTEVYSWNALGGFSWAIPYIAGLYALACQVYPDITPELFLKYVKETADTVTVDYWSVQYEIEIINPVSLINRLK